MSTEQIKAPGREARKNRLTARDVTYIAAGTALMAICSWITVPGTVPFTLQTFGVFMAVGLLGGRRGTLSVMVYILLGAIGLPVFAGFSGGLGALFGSTGGYIIGFLFSALAMWLVTALLGEKTLPMAAGMLAGLLLCYAFGTAWFLIAYTHTTGPVALGTVIGWCVTPFIVPDLAKIALALFLTKRLKKRIPE